MSNYAVMWASTQNLGDDIQTLAAINFLNKIGINSLVVFGSGNDD